MKLSLLVLAAGMGSRYGGLKQLDAVGPNGETLLDYSIYDAIKAGFSEIIFVIRRDMEELFRTHVGDRITKAFPDVLVHYAFQEKDDLSEGFLRAESRTKPWGTGHALLAARTLIRSPFAVINADDYYGASGFEKVAHFLKKQTKASWGIVAYLLKNTLSDHGSVSRGIVTTENNFLASITERTSLRKVDGKIVAQEKNGEVIPCTGEEFVSMNFWALTPDIFSQLERLFTEFLKQLGKDNAASAEFYLPSAISSCIAEKSAAVELLTTNDSWFGLTYSEDHSKVTSALSTMIEEGKYPSPLF